MKSQSSAQQILFSQFYQKKFEEALSKKEYGTALKLIQHVQSKKNNTFHHEQIAIFTNLKLFADCTTFCDHALKNYIKDDPLSQIQCRISTALSYQKLYQIEKAKKNIGFAEQDLDFHKDKLSQGIAKTLRDKIVEVNQLIESTEVVPIEKRKDEARAYKQLIDDEKINQDLNEEGKTVYLIPTTWLTKWKEYTGYSQLFESSDAMEEETTGNEASKRFEDIFPGAIDTRTLLESSPISQLLDTQESEFHSNYILKEGLIENKDFLIATQPIANFFYDIYGGIRLKRLTLENPVTKEINVDLFFKKVTFMPFPQLHTGQTKELIYSVYVSKFATVKELFQKIKRASQSLPNLNISTWNCQYFKFYRLSEQQAKEYEHVHKTLIDRVRDAQITLDVKAVKVEETSFVDDMQIDSKDIFIFELSDSSNFRLTNSKGAAKSSSDEEDSKSQSNQSNSTLATNQIVEEDNNTSNSIYPTGKIKLRPLTETQISNIKKYVNIPPPPRGFGGKKGVTGLQNLGNTCFMNSSLQCLSNVEELTTFLINNSYLSDLNPKNVLGAEGKLATAYAGLMRAMWSGGESYVSAHEFKKVIGKFAPQFYGYGQQDSQELLSYLLDGLHEDLNRVVKKPAVESIDYFGDSKWTEEQQKQHDSEMAPKFFMNYKKRNDSVISDLMVGQFKSTLICPQCKRISIIFDPYLMLSVPVSKTTVNVDELSFYFIFKDFRRTPIKLTPTVRHNMTISEFKEVLSSLVNVPAQDILAATINKLRLESIVENVDTIQTLADKSGVAFFYEIDKPYKLLPVEDGNQTATMQIEEESNQKKQQTTATEEDNTTNSETQKPTEIEEEPQQKTTSSETDQMHQESQESNYLVQVQIFMTSPKNITACQTNNISSIVTELKAAQLKSYTRFLSLHPSTTISDLYIQMYRILRPHLEIYAHSNQQPAIKVDIQISDDSQPTLEKEATEFLGLDNQLFTFLAADYSRIQLDNTNLAISLNRSDAEQSITVNIFLSDVFDFKTLKLQRCDVKNFDFPKSTYQVSKKNGIHLYDCLDAFVKCEKLGQGNEWYCSGCSKHVLATKQMQIYKTPKILIVHIKRFKSGNVRNFGRYFYESGGQKINDEIDFPIENLDMTKYVLGAEGIPQVYDLFAVSEHYGSLGGGHYTACAKNFLDQRWYNFNDSHASPTTASQAVSNSAYVLFYRRRN